MPVEERPREKAKKYGITVLSDKELLAILLRHGYHGHSSLSIAEEILKKARGIENLSRLSIQDLKEVKGVKEVKAIEILACFELSKRMHYERLFEKDVIKEPSDLITWLMKELGTLEQENFLVVYLNIKNHIQGHKILFKGTVDKSLVHPREIFKEALRLSSSRIMVVHNHPSGDCTPSNADISITKQLYDCGEMMGILLLDHLIVSSYTWFSFKGNGLI